jgi:predicted permease
MGWMHKVRALFRREHFSADLDEELEFHLAMREQLNAEEGMPREDARSDAMRRFGNPARWKEKMREIDVFTLPETVWQDLRFAARMLAKHRGFTAVAILALGIGIGVNTAIFTVYKSFLLRPLDASDTRQLVNISRTNYQGKYDPTFSFADYEAYRDHNHVFSGMVAATEDEVALSGVGDAPGAGRSMEGRLARLVGFRLPTLMSGGAEFGTASIVSDNYFSVLGENAVRGRTFSPNDPYDYAADPNVLISENYWQRRFRGDPAILGRSITLNGVAFTVIGITPRDFMGTNINVPNFWIPIRQWDLLHPRGTVLHDRENACCRLYGRLSRNIRVSEAQAEMNLLADQLRSQHAPHSDASKPATIQLYPGSSFGRDLQGELNFAVALIMCAVGMFLLIACANLASLQLARAAARQNEMGIRLSLGASRGRLIRQLLTESALLGLLAGFVSFFLTWCILRFLVAEIAATLPAEWGTFAMHVAPDMRVFGYVFAVSLVAGLLFGLAPALESSKPSLSSALKEEGAHLVFSAGKFRVRDALIALQVAVCLVLMITGGLLIRSSVRALEMETGYETKRVLSLDLYFPDGFGYSREKQTSEARELYDRIRVLPGVADVTFGRPPDGGGMRTATVTLNQKKSPADNSQLSLYYNYVRPNYFRALNIPLSLGTVFPEAQGRLGAVVILSESAAKELWPAKNPIGQRLVLDGTKQFHSKDELTPDGSSYQVIGIARDTRAALIDGMDMRKVYLPLPLDRLDDRPLLVRTKGDPRLLVDGIAKLVHALDSNMIIYSETLDGLLTTSPQFVTSRCAALFSSIVGALGLLLAAIGIYGTVSYAVVRRTREVGVRMALGAQKRDVIKLMLVESTRPVLAGLSIGVIGAAGAAHLMRALLFGVNTLDAASFVGVPGLFFLIAMIAAYMPAQRATRVDPMVALRYE